MKPQKSIKDEILQYAKENFKTEPDYPWQKFPSYAVLRHDNSKWYAVIMEVPKYKIGLDGDEEVSVMNVKSDPLLIGSLLGNDGYCPAYHMNKEHWISVLLDGTVTIEEIINLINLSFDMIDNT